MSFSPYGNDWLNQQDTAPRDPSSGPNSANLIIVIAIIGFLLFMFFPQFKDAVNPQPNPKPSPVNPVDPVNPVNPVNPVSLEGTYIVRLYETEADKMPTWLVKLLDNDSFWFDELAKLGVDYYTIDPSSNPKDAESFMQAANKRNVSPPCWIHCKKGGIVLSATAFKQSDTVDSIKRVLTTQKP